MANRTGSNKGKNYNKRDNPICRDPRPCFGRRGIHCTILTESFDGCEKKCPFCKPFRTLPKDWAPLVDRASVVDIDGEMYIKLK